MRVDLSPVHSMHQDDGLTLRIEQNVNIITNHSMVWVLQCDLHFGVT